MAIQKPTLAKGTRDFGPKEVQRRKYILNTIETVFKKFGFMPLETPAMENLTTLEGKYGDEGDKLLFRILNSGDFADYTKFSIKQYFQNIVIQILYDIINDINTNYRTLSDKDIKDKFLLLTSIENNKLEGYFLSYGNQLTNFDKVIILELIESFHKVISESISVEFQSLKTEELKNDLYRIISNILEADSNRVLYQRVFSKSIHLLKFISEKGLRYDLTVPFARFVVMNRNEITFPFKRYQMQPVWRADRPQKGRYREFWQCDADVVGSDSLINEVELIQIYHEAFTTLGIDYEIKLNNRKVLAGIAEVVKSVDEMQRIATAIDKLDKIGVDGVKKELMEQGYSDTELNTLFNIITIQGENTDILNQLKKHLHDSETGMQGIDELSFVLNTIQSIHSSNNINLKLDFSLARGLSYYTGCILEVVATTGTLKSSIGGGGRYDNLTGIFGLPNVSGVGISFGLDRIYDVMEELNLFPESINRATATQILFCHFDEATQHYCLPALNQLRNAGIAAEVYPDVVKKKAIAKQLDYANALGIQYAAIAGETEMQNQVFNFKNLLTGEQSQKSISDIIQLLS